MSELGAIIGATVDGMGGPWGFLGAAVLAVLLALGMSRGLVWLCDRGAAPDATAALLAGGRAALASDDGRPRLCWQCGFPCRACHADDGRPGCTCPCYS
jgi:hypothetical protein